MRADRGRWIDRPQGFIEDFARSNPKLGQIRHHSTVINSRSARKRLSLIPRTMIRCSTRRNGPYFSRCSMMRAARALPMPGSDSNSLGGAVLILILRDCSWFDGAGNSRDACDVGKFVRARFTQAGAEGINAKNSAR